MMQEGGPSKPLSLVVGSAELPLLRKQTADFCRASCQIWIASGRMRKFLAPTISPSWMK